MPPTYPATAPDVIITRSSGIGDEGEREILQELQNNVLSNTFGETCVYQLIYGAIEQLEAKNSCGECAICFEQLLPESCDHPELVAVRTDCFHVFHIECLARWFAVRKALARQKAPELPSRSRSRAIELKVHEKHRAVQNAEAALRANEVALDRARQELVQFQQSEHANEGDDRQDKSTYQRLQQNVKSLQTQHSRLLQSAQRAKAQLAAQEEQLQACIAQEQEQREAEEDSDHYCPVCRTNLHLHKLDVQLQSSYQHALEQEQTLAGATSEPKPCEPMAPQREEQEEDDGSATLDSAGLPGWLIARIRETQQWQRDTWSRLKANHSST